jgi:hypothetical protein
VHLSARLDMLKSIFESFLVCYRFFCVYKYMLFLPNIPCIYMFKTARQSVFFGVSLCGGYSSNYSNLHASLKCTFYMCMASTRFSSVGSISVVGCSRSGVRLLPTTAQVRSLCKKKKLPRLSRFFQSTDITR